MINNRKSQAALEFLMTYGWAILVVLVAVGALAYFGVLNPDKFLPSVCTLQSGITCVDRKVEAAAGAGGVGLVTVRLTNSLGYDVDTISVKAGNCGNYPGSAGSTGSFTLANGISQTYTIPCTAAITSSKYSQQLNVSYRNIDTTVSHNNIGQLTTRTE